MKGLLLKKVVCVYWVAEGLRGGCSEDRIEVEWMGLRSGPRADESYCAVGDPL
jgi:hypothetical protein